MIVPTLCVGTPSEGAPRPALDLRQRFVDVLDLALIDAERRGLRSHAERGNDHYCSHFKLLACYFQVFVGTRIEKVVQ